MHVDVGNWPKNIYDLYDKRRQESQLKNLNHQQLFRNNLFKIDFKKQCCEICCQFLIKLCGFQLRTVW